MTHSATLFGFGSYFAKGPAFANDVDLLLVHRNAGRDSIEFAISCKKVIQATIPAAHVIMLSDSEECELDFIRRSNAVYLTEIDDQRPSKQIAALGKSIMRPFPRW